MSDCPKVLRLNLLCRTTSELWMDSNYGESEITTIPTLEHYLRRITPDTSNSVLSLCSKENLIYRDFKTLFIFLEAA